MTKKREAVINTIKQALIDRRDKIIEEARRSIKSEEMQNGVHGDFVDMANYKMDSSLYIRMRDRERKLIKKINKALDKIDKDTYGICEMCGKLINIERLEIRPVADYCIECKEKQEKEEK